jgi:hypothetical protein
VKQRLKEVGVLYSGMFWSGGGLFQQPVTVVFGDEEKRKRVERFMG